MKRSRFKGVTGGADGKFVSSPERNRRFRARMLQGRQSKNISDQRPEVTGIAPRSSAGYPNKRDYSLLGGSVRRQPNLNEPVPREGVADWDEQRREADEVSSFAARNNLDKKSAEVSVGISRAMREMIEAARARARRRINEKQ